MNLRKPYLLAALALALIAAGPSMGIAGERASQDSLKKGGANQSFDSFQKESEASMKMDRGEPGINDGGQAIKPGEGEQDGRPGTIGGSATLPPQKEAVQYEGADKGRQTPLPTEKEASTPY